MLARSFERYIVSELPINLAASAVSHQHLDCWQRLNWDKPAGIICTETKTEKRRLWKKRVCVNNNPPMTAPPQPLLYSSIVESCGVMMITDQWKDELDLKEGILKVALLIHTGSSANIKKQRTNLRSLSRHLANLCAYFWTWIERKLQTQPDGSPIKKYNGGLLFGYLVTKPCWPWPTYFCLFSKR